MSTDRGMDKEDRIHVHNGIWVSHKKGGNNTTYSDMGGHRDGHTEKNEYHVLSLICGI